MTVPGNLLGARRLKETLDRHGFRPRKGLGQNFVTDPNTIRKVIDVARLGRDDRVLEIGAGAGSLTLGLARVCAHVVAVEFDDALIPVLAETLDGVPNVEVVHADAVEMDIESIEASKLVANLPYNIAATVVLRVLTDAPQIRHLTVMTQREVGERLAAAPGSKTYGLTSVLVAYHGVASVAGTISRHVFHPVPRVDSVLVRIERRNAPLPVSDERLFVAVVRAAFAQRRKTLRNALATVAGSPERAERALVEAGVGPGRRAEQVSPEDFATLTDALANG